MHLFTPLIYPHLEPICSIDNVPDFDSIFIALTIKRILRAAVKVRSITRSQNNLNPGV